MKWYNQGVNTADLAAAAAPAAAALQKQVAKNPQAAANLVSAGARSFNKWNNPNGSDSVRMQTSSLNVLSYGEY